MRDLSKSYIWYSKDWRSDDRVFNLTPSQRGIYREMIDEAYAHNNRVPLDVQAFARLWNSTVSEIQNAIDHLSIIGLIECNGETYSIPSVNKRLVAINTGSKGGRKSVKIRKLINPFEGGLITQDKDKDKDKDINIPFSVFWDSYGKKIDRPKCESKWNKLTNEERESIIDYIPKYKASIKDDQFIRYPATFLNNRTWENELPKAKVLTRTY